MPAAIQLSPLTIAKSIAQTFFMAGTISIAVPANNSAAQIFNQAVGPGVTGLVGYATGVYLAASAATDIILARGAVAFASIGVNTINFDFSGVAGGSTDIQNRVEQVNTGIFSGPRFNVIAGQTIPVIFPTPIRIPPGFSLNAQAVTQNVALYATFVWYQTTGPNS